MAALTVRSGGQTGVDRAALDAALAASVPVTGWCPAGRRAEDGPIPERYPLTETPRTEYAQRTSWNVRDADATLILARGPLEGGTAKTARSAEGQGRPLRVVDLAAEPDTTAAAEAAAVWIQEMGTRELNVAGPRESTAPGIYAEALVFMTALLRALRV